MHEFLSILYLRVQSRSLFYVFLFFPMLASTFDVDPKKFMKNSTFWFTTFQDVESAGGCGVGGGGSRGSRTSIQLFPSEMKKLGTCLNENTAHNGHVETRDTVVERSGNGAVSVQPVMVTNSSRKNSSSNKNPFVDPSQRHSSVDMKG